MNWLRKYLVPRFELSGWFADGLHGRSTLDGSSFSVAWLGLHIEIVVAIERSWKSKGAGQ